MQEKRIPEGRSGISTFSAIDDELDYELKDILERDPSDTDDLTRDLPQNNYKACLNFEMIEALGGQPLLDTLNEMGGWPVITKNWDSAGANWYKDSVMKSCLNMLFKTFLIGHIWLSTCFIKVLVQELVS